MTTETPKEREDHWAKERLDLVRRLFAIAISVGVGAALVKTGWVTEGHFPHRNEWEQIAIVFLALFATVLSWDGYLMSVRKKPLHDWPRFTIDIFLVFTYMFLIVTSDKGQFWLPIVCVIYAMYILWDALSVRQFPKIFDASAVDVPRRWPTTLIRVYGLAVVNKPGIDRGPIISLCWGCYFGLLLGLVHLFPRYNTFLALAFTFLGMCCYRWDKARLRNGVRGFTMGERLAFIGLLAFLAVLLGLSFRTLA
jgi:hypothetical protein